MTRCRDCDTVLTPAETECISCGAPVVAKESAKSIFGQRFTGCIKMMFFASAGLTVASLFFDATPSFTKCVTCTLVLAIVKSSAEQMYEKKKD